ncbi:hypothetical protein GCM10009818_34190 [Nakamurella flavida]
MTGGEGNGTEGGQPGPEVVQHRLVDRRGCCGGQGHDGGPLVGGSPDHDRGDLPALPPVGDSRTVTGQTGVSNRFDRCLPTLFT